MSSDLFRQISILAKKPIYAYIVANYPFFASILSGLRRTGRKLEKSVKIVKKQVFAATGKKSDWKKAIITLEKGQSIDYYSGSAQKSGIVLPSF